MEIIKAYSHVATIWGTGVLWTAALVTVAGGAGFGWSLLLTGAAAALTVVAVLRRSMCPTQEAFKLGYDKGWREGRECQRKINVIDRDDVVRLDDYRPPVERPASRVVDLTVEGPLEWVRFGQGEDRVEGVAEPVDPPVEAAQSDPPRDRDDFVFGIISRRHVDAAGVVPFGGR